MNLICERKVYMQRTNGNELSYRKRDDDNEDGTFISMVTIAPIVSITGQ
jgi:hypothetical protein